MPADERRRLLTDVSQQVAELTALMDNLVELAHDTDTSTEETTEIDLDRVVTAAVDRAVGAPDVTIELDLEPARMEGRRQQLERAIVNVLDNACKWSPPGERVEVGLHDGTLTVRDHGPGIDAADLPLVLRPLLPAPAARAMPGSGLGLAIVRRVIDGHGGSIIVESPLAPERSCASTSRPQASTTARSTRRVGRSSGPEQARVPELPGAHGEGREPVQC